MNGNYEEKKVKRRPEKEQVTGVISTIPVCGPSGREELGPWHRKCVNCRCAILGLAQSSKIVNLVCQRRNAAGLWFGRARDTVNTRIRMN